MGGAMPEIICRKCGHITNTAVADHIDSKDDKADGCYARYTDERWEKGCSYDEADPFFKQFADKVMQNKDVESYARGEVDA